MSLEFTFSADLFSAKSVSTHSWKYSLWWLRGSDRLWFIFLFYSKSKNNIELCYLQQSNPFRKFQKCLLIHKIKQKVSFSKHKLPIFKQKMVFYKAKCGPFLSRISAGLSQKMSMSGNVAVVRNLKMKSCLGIRIMVLSSTANVWQ